MPITNGKVPIGAIRTCSSVPDSFSRTIESAVDATAVIIAMYAISPGTRNSVLRSSGLYQMRGSTRSGDSTSTRPDRAVPASRAMLSAYPITVVAVLALSPLISTWTTAGRPETISRLNPSGMTSTARAAFRSSRRSASAGE